MLEPFVQMYPWKQKDPMPGSKQFEVFGLPWYNYFEVIGPEESHYIEVFGPSGSAILGGVYFYHHSPPQKNKVPQMDG